MEHPRRIGCPSLRQDHGGPGGPTGPTVTQSLEFPSLRLQVPAAEASFRRREAEREVCQELSPGPLTRESEGTSGPSVGTYSSPSFWEKGRVLGQSTGGSWCLESAQLVGRPARKWGLGLQLRPVLQAETGTSCRAVKPAAGG